MSAAPQKQTGDVVVGNARHKAVIMLLDYKKKAARKPQTKSKGRSLIKKVYEHCSCNLNDLCEIQFFKYPKTLVHVI